MKTRFTRHMPSPAMVIAMVALVVAMSGTAVAAGLIGPKDIAKNAVLSKHIKKGAVGSSDLSKSVKAKLAKAGTPGATGAAGPAGAKGDKGDKGDTGAAGAAGADATKLFASVNSNCTAFVFSSGTVSLALPFASRCDVKFDRTVTNCAAVATQRGTSGGELTTGKTGDGLSGIDADEIGVVFRDSAGAFDPPRPFELAVFC